MSARISRWTLNSIMMLGLVASMSYSLLGESVHEWVGTAVLVCFIWHLLRNRGWFSALRRGRYTGGRMVGSIVNGLILFTVLGLCVSSLMLSKYVFAFLPLSLPEGVGQTPHQVCAYWGFLLMAVHLGWHGRSLAAAVKRHIALPGAVWRGVLALVIVVGVVSAVLHQYPAHLFLQVRGFESGLGLLPFLVGEAALFALFALAGAGCKHLLQRRKGDH